MPQREEKDGRPGWGPSTCNSDWVCVTGCGPPKWGSAGHLAAETLAQTKKIPGAHVAGDEAVALLRPEALSRWNRETAQWNAQHTADRASGRGTGKRGRGRVPGAFWRG